MKNKIIIYNCAIVAGVLLPLIGTYLVYDKTTEKQQIVENKDSSDRDTIKTKSNEIKELSDSIKAISIKIDSINIDNNILIKKNSEISEQINEIGRETNLLTRENKSMSEQISMITKDSRDLITGGDGLLKILPNGLSIYEGPQIDGYLYSLNLEMILDGKYALDNVKIKGYVLTDYEQADPTFLYHDLSESGLNIHSRFPKMPSNIAKLFSQQIWRVDEKLDVFKPLQRIILHSIGFKEVHEYLGINIFVETKRQDWIILLRYKMNFEQGTGRLSLFPSCYYRILQVLPGGIKDVYTYPDASYIKRIKWYKMPLPNVWFVDHVNPEQL